MGLVLSDAPVGLVLLSVGCGLALKDVRQGLRGVRLAGHLNDFFLQISANRKCSSHIRLVGEK